MTFRRSGPPPDPHSCQFVTSNGRMVSNPVTMAGPQEEAGCKSLIQEDISE
jgi:hypothetical protein